MTRSALLPLWFSVLPAAAQTGLIMGPPQAASATRECERLLGDGQAAAARSCFEARLAAAPSDAVTHARLAELLAGENSWSDAVRHLERARELAPREPSLAWNLALLYIEQQRSDEAIATLRELLQLAPDHAPAYRSLASLLQQRQRLAEAEQVMRDYLERVPRDPDGLYFLGTIAAERNQFDQAESWMRRALELAPDHGAARYGLGLVLSHDPNRIDEALQQLEQAERSSPKEPLIPYWIGTLQLQRGAVEAAVGALQRAVELDPEQPHALYALAQATIRSGDRERGRELLQAFQSRKSQTEGREARLRTAMAAFGRSRELLEAGDLIGAARALREAAAAEPENPHHWAQLAKLELSLGAPESALESISMARGLAAGESEYLYLESLSLAHMGRAEAARASAAAAVQRDPTVASYHNQLGLTLQKLGRLEEAIGAYRRAVELMPQEASYLLNLATALEAGGDLEASAAAMARYQAISGGAGGAR
ncbi:MAG TPA: tetratricopeptide repeat protein [Acidobacteriota bacterium]